MCLSALQFRWEISEFSRTVDRTLRLFWQFCSLKNKRQVATISVNIPTKGTDWLRVHELLAYLFIANGRGNKCLFQLLYSGDVMEQTPDVNYMISTPKHVELSWKTKKTKTGWNTGTGWMAMACDSTGWLTGWSESFTIYLHPVQQH